MKLKVLASGSSANGYIIQNENEVLIIELGAKILQYKDYLNFDISKVVGCLVSHSHKDHSKHAAEFMRMGIPLYSHEDLFLNSIHASHNFKPMQPQQTYKIGGFKVIGFDLNHDVRNFGFVIHHEDCGNILFCTDTYMIPYKFENLNHIMIESNYCYDSLDANTIEGKINPFLGNRIVRSHLELNNMLDFLERTDLTDVQNIVLIHLSFLNSDKDRMVNETKELTNKNVFVAENGLEIELNKEVF